jgi:hypothetical protein
VVKKSGKSRKPLSAQVRKKISRALDARVTTDEEKGLSKTKVAATLLGSAALAGAGIYGLKKYKAGGFAKKGTPKNPYVERALTPQLPDKVKKRNSSARRSFMDTLGKTYKKGSFLPSRNKGVSDVGLVKRYPSGNSVTKRPGYSQEQQVKIAVDSSNSQAIARPKDITLKRKPWYISVKEKFGFSLKPYKTSDINFGRAKTAEEKQKISKGVKAWWSKQPRDNDVKEEKEYRPVIKNRQDAERAGKIGEFYQLNKSDSRINPGNVEEVYKKVTRGETIGGLATASALLGGLGLYGYKQAQKDTQLQKSLNTVWNDNFVSTSKSREAINKRLDSLLDPDRAAKVESLNRSLGVKAQSLKKLNRQRQIRNAIRSVPSRASKGVVYIGKGVNSIKGPTGAKLIGTAVVAGLGASAGAKIAKERYFKNKNKDKK